MVILKDNQVANLNNEICTHYKNGMILRRKFKNTLF